MGSATLAVHSRSGCHASRIGPRKPDFLHLACHAAEEVVLDQPTLGAGGGPQSDLARATALAFTLEASVGAGAHQPFVYEPPVAWEEIIASDYGMRKRVSECPDKRCLQALDLMRHNEQMIRSTAEALVSHGTLEGV